MFQASYPRQELAKWNQQDQSWEMPQLGLLGMRQQLSGSFPKSGLVVHGALYRLPTQVRLMDESDGGALHGSHPNWPTPASRDYKGAVKNTTTLKNNRFIRTGKDGTEYSATLDGAVKLSWPTPTTSDRYNAHHKDNHDVKRGLLRGVVQHWPTLTATDTTVKKARSPEKMIRPDGRNVLRLPSLAEQVVQDKNFPYTNQDLEKQKQGKKYTKAKQHWPTPSANEDAAGSPDGKMQKMLGNHPDVRSQAEGTLNPDWVSWLMGIPTGWESLKPMGRETYDDWFKDMTNGTWWHTERDLPRVATGKIDRVKRLKALGNGVVPASMALFIQIFTNLVDEE